MEFYHNHAYFIALQRMAMTQRENMTTAMAKALVESLHGESAQETWSTLNQRSASAYAEEPPLDGMLLYVERGLSPRKERRDGEAGAENHVLIQISCCDSVTPESGSGGWKDIIPT